MRFLLFLLCCFSLGLRAQRDSALTAHLDALLFMADNEFDGRIQRGFTLPGAWLRPSVAYRLHPQVRLEGGVHALIYYGADKYPSYAFHDLPRWRGSQHQRGAHLLPLLRADVQLGALSLTLGDLHGHTQHDLALPLYNPQSLITTDPERGIQFRLPLSRYQLDAWVDWQSFIFDGSDHQEVFVSGVSQRFHLLSPRAHGWRLSLPLQVIAQHRGGEQDVPNRGVQTFVNAAIGLDAHYLRPRHVLHRLEAQLLALASYQQAGRLWPFDTGAAFWAQLAAHWRLAPESHLRLGLGCLHAPRQFATLLGTPFFGTLSLKEPGSTFLRTTTAHWNLLWQRQFGPRIALSVYALGYVSAPTTLLAPNGTRQPVALSTPFTLGLTLRVRPQWNL